MAIFRGDDTNRELLRAIETAMVEARLSATELRHLAEASLRIGPSQAAQLEHIAARTELAALSLSTAMSDAAYGSRSATRGSLSVLLALFAAVAVSIAGGVAQGFSLNLIDGDTVTNPDEEPEIVTTVDDQLTLYDFDLDRNVDAVISSGSGALQLISRTQSPPAWTYIAPPLGTVLAATVAAIVVWTPRRRADAEAVGAATSESTSPPTS